LYSNATVVIPVAEAMLTKGVAVGTTLALFAVVLAVAFTLVGWGFNVIA
jgi:hypothetical protein